MRWMRERDALIAQTLAFVQSVAGKKNHAGEPSPRFAPEQPQQDAGPLGTEPPHSAEAVEPAESLSAPQPPVVSSDLKAELKARIASFRAHQERFNREREEYFSATLTRLRASIRDAPPPRPRK